MNTVDPRYILYNNDNRPPVYLRFKDTRFSWAILKFVIYSRGVSIAVRNYRLSPIACELTRITMCLKDKKSETDKIIYSKLQLKLAAQ